jgi:hypothetical protein
MFCRKWIVYFDTVVETLGGLLWKNCTSKSAVVIWICCTLCHACLKKSNNHEGQDVAFLSWLVVAMALTMIQMRFLDRMDNMKLSKKLRTYHIRLV